MGRKRGNPRWQDFQAVATMVSAMRIVKPGLSTKAIARSLSKSGTFKIPSRWAIFRSSRYERYIRKARAEFPEMTAPKLKKSLLREFSAADRIAGIDFADR
jgi:hypothetical protein